MTITNGTNGTTTRARTTRSRTAAKKALTDVKAKTSGKEAFDSVSKAASSVRKLVVERDVAELSKEKLATTAAKVKVEVSRALDMISQVGDETFAELEKVRDAVKFKKEELEQLHDNDIVASSTKDLIVQHEETMTELEVLHANRKNLLDTESKEARIQWIKEKEERDELLTRENDEVEVQRNRNSADFNYNLKVQRQVESDRFDQSVRMQKRSEEERVLMLKREWEDREAACAERERKVERFEDRVANIDTEIKAVADKQVAIATNSIKKNYSHETQLNDMQFASEKVALSSQISALTQSNEDKNEVIARLTSDLNDSKNQVANLATKALEAQSGQKALEAVQHASERGQESKRR